MSVSMHIPGAGAASAYPGPTGAPVKVAGAG
jgi:hypothetical protein